jgi:PiT family inorganic phosphate transporter
MANEDIEARHLETLDRDLGRFVKLETAASYVSRPLVAPGIALVFIILAGLGAAMLLGQTSQMLVVVAAAVFGAYMALNIGANDVANNMGPAVGATPELGWRDCDCGGV